MKTRVQWRRWPLVITIAGAVVLQICLLRWWEPTIRVLHSVTLALLIAAGIAALATTIALLRGGGSIEE